jgi:hypothetical protein
MILPSWLERRIDEVGLLVALIVDIILNVVCFSILAPDPWTSLAFISVGIMTVLFVFRSWSRRHIVAWVIFVIVVFFFDLSFTLEATKTQSTRGDDTELTRLTAKVDESSVQVLALQAQYDRAVQRATMDQLDEQIKIAQTKVDKYEQDRKARIAAISEGHIERPRLTADAIFSAIPQSIIDGRLIQLFIFSMIFAGLQLIIATSIEVNARAVAVIVEAPASVALEPDPPEVSEGHIAAFVKYSWYKIRGKTDATILTEDVFLRLMKAQNKTYSEDVYRYLRARAIALGIIDERGLANMADEDIIVDMLKREVLG